MIKVFDFNFNEYEVFNFFDVNVLKRSLEKRKEVKYAIEDTKDFSDKNKDHLKFIIRNSFPDILQKDIDGYQYFKTFLYQLELHIQRPYYTLYDKNKNKKFKVFPHFICGISDVTEIEKHKKEYIDSAIQAVIELVEENE